MVADTLNLGGRGRRIFVSSRSARTTQRLCFNINFFTVCICVCSMQVCMCVWHNVWESENKFGCQSLTSPHFEMILLLVFIV